MGPSSTEPTGGRHRDAVPGLRILHLGAQRRFAALAGHTGLTADGWREAVAAGADLLLLEPPSEAPGWDPLEGGLPTLLAAAAGAGIPTVRIHPAPPDADVAGHATLELVETAPGGPSAGGDRLPVTVDTTRLHPGGWTHTPPDAVVARLGRPPDATGRDLLRCLDPTPTLLLEPRLAGALDPEVLRGPGGLDRTRRVSSTARLARLLHRAGVLLDHPGWQRDAAQRWRGCLAALACGVPVVSVDPVHGGWTPGVVTVTADQATATVHGLLVDGDARERLSIAGRRHALATADRRSALLTILDHLGVHRPAPPTTTVLLATHRPELLDHALGSIRRQRQDGVDVSLVLHGPGFEGVDLPDRGPELAQVVRAPASWNLGDCLNAALEGARGHLVAKMDDDDHYAPDHLTDLVLAWRYSGAEVVGKRIEFIHLAERDVTLRRRPSQPERDRPHVGGPTLLADRATLRRFGFLRLPNRVDSTLYERVLAAGGRVYGTHSRDVVLSRRGGGHGHAWQVTEEELLTGTAWTRPGLDLAAASSDPGQG